MTVRNSCDGAFLSTCKWVFVGREARDDGSGKWSTSGDIGEKMMIWSAMARRQAKTKPENGGKNRLKKPSRAMVIEYERETGID